jgi:transposase
MFIMPKAFPEEFRRDVVAVARKGEAPITQIAKDFGVSPAALHRWMKIADREDGVKSGAVSDDAAKLREANKRIRLLEQEAEVMRRAVAYLSRDINPKK